MSNSLQDAISAIRAGDKATGQRLLAEVIRNDPRNEAAWLWMSSVIDSDEHRRTCLQRVLAINPHNATARRGLEAIQQRVSIPSQAGHQPVSMPSASIGALQPINRADAPSDKKCPYCAESIKADAVFCRFCGRDLRTGLPSPQTFVASSQPIQVRLPPQRLWSPGVAALLSLIIPGAGQMYKGQVGKGLLYLFVVGIGYALLVVPGIILHILVIVDAASGNPYAQYPVPQNPGQPAVQMSARKQNSSTWLWIVGAIALLLIVLGCLSLLVVPVLGSGF